MVTTTATPGRRAFRRSAVGALALAAVLLAASPTSDAFAPPGRARNRTPRASKARALLASTLTSPASSGVGRRMPIDESYPGLRRVHSDPDVYVIENFLDAASCDDLVERARERGTERSPVAYAGWTEDVKELLGLAASGPVSWLAILGAWYEAQGDEGASVLTLVIHAVRNYVALLPVALVGIAAFTKLRANGLQDLRTSTSTTLDDLAQPGPKEFVRRASALYGPASSRSGVPEASFFEAPTVIRYEEGQVLAPHYDANRSADLEDANRGGQTLSTLLVYLNDVSRGGTTRFGRLPPSDDPRQAPGMPNLEIVPRRGDALLFFPADADGRFDERAEHEGRPAVDEKWIARIWRHAGDVPPPFGLSAESIERYL